MSKSPESSLTLEGNTVVAVDPLQQSEGEIRSTRHENVTVIKEEVVSDDEVESSTTGMDSENNTNIQTTDNLAPEVKLEFSDSENEEHFETIDVNEVLCAEVKSECSDSENEEFLETFEGNDAICAEVQCSDSENEELFETYSGNDGTVRGSVESIVGKTVDTENDCGVERTNVDGKNSSCNRNIVTSNEIFDFDDVEGMSRATSARNIFQTGSEASYLDDGEDGTSVIQAINETTVLESGEKGREGQVGKNVPNEDCGEDKLFLTNVTYNKEQFQMTTFPIPKPVNYTRLREVTRRRELRELVRILSKETEIGVDLVINSLTYAPTIHAILLSTKTEDILIDAMMVGPDFSELNEIFMNQKIVKVFYNSQLHQTVMHLHSLDLHVRNIFDITTAFSALDKTLPHFWAHLRERYGVQSATYGTTHKIEHPLAERARNWYKLRIHYHLHLYHSVKNDLLAISEEKCREVLDNCNKIPRTYYSIDCRYKKAFDILVGNIKRVHEAQLMFLEKLEKWRISVAKNKNTIANLVLSPRVMVALTLDMPLCDVEISSYFPPGKNFNRVSDKVKELALNCRQNLSSASSILKLRRRIKSNSVKLLNRAEAGQEVESFKHQPKAPPKFKRNYHSTVDDAPSAKRARDQRKERNDWNSATSPKISRREKAKMRKNPPTSSDRREPSRSRHDDNSTRSSTSRHLKYIARDTNRTTGNSSLCVANQLPQNSGNVTPNAGNAAGGNLAELAQSLSNVANLGGQQGQIIPDIIKLAQNLVTLLPQAAKHVPTVQAASYNPTLQPPNSFNTNVQPSSYNAGVQPAISYNPTFQPHNSFNANVQPSSFNAAVQPSSYNAAVQPSSYNAAVQPSSFNAAVQPNSFNAAVQPNSFKAAVQPAISYNPAFQPPNSFNSNVQPNNFNLAVQQTSGFSATVQYPNSYNTNVQNNFSPSVPQGSGVSIVAQQSIKIKPAVQYAYGFNANVGGSSNFNASSQQINTLKSNVQQPNSGSPIITSAQAAAMFVQGKFSELNSGASKQQSERLDQISITSTQLETVDKLSKSNKSGKRASRFNKLTRPPPIKFKVNASNQKQQGKQIPQGSSTTQTQPVVDKLKFPNIVKYFNQFSNPPSVSSTQTASQPSNSSKQFSARSRPKSPTSPLTRSFHQRHKDSDKSPTSPLTRSFHQRHKDSDNAKRRSSSKGESKSAGYKKRSSLGDDDYSDRDMEGDPSVFQAPPAPRISGSNLNDSDDEDDGPWSGKNLDLDQIDERISQLRHQYASTKRHRRH